MHSAELFGYSTKNVILFGGRKPKTDLNTYYARMNFVRSSKYIPVVGCNVYVFYMGGGGGWGGDALTLGCDQVVENV